MLNAECWEKSVNNGDIFVTDSALVLHCWDCQSVAQAHYNYDTSLQQQQQQQYSNSNNNTLTADTFLAHSREQD